MKDKVPSFLLKTEAEETPSASRGLLGPSFIDGGLADLACLIRDGQASASPGDGRRGLFQRLDPRLKILFLAFFIVIVSLRKDIETELIISLLALSLVLLSRLSLWRFYRRILFLTFLFGFLAAAPAALNVITPGRIILSPFELPRSYDLWIYHIPQTIGFTREGLLGVAILCLRVLNSLALTTLVLQTTAFAEIIRALKVFRVPDAFLLTLSLSYQYLLVSAKTVSAMYLARKGRTLGEIPGEEGRVWIAGRLAFLFSKTRHHYEEVFKAMQGRGLSDTVVLPAWGTLTPINWLAGILLLLAGLFLGVR